MIEEIGTITAVDEDHIWVETEIKSTCGSCAVNDNCGTGVVAKAFAPKKEVLILRCQQQAEVGQQVKLGIPESQLLSASALVYMLPLTVLVLSALLGQWSLAQFGLTSELWIIGLAAVSTCLSFIWVKQKLSADTTHKYKPRLIALLPAKSSQIDVKELSA